ncbi:MAG: hypothetical protein ABI787_10320 [Spartobacteria bacterium]
MAPIIEKRRLTSPCETPQALAWDGKEFWLSSRDLGTLYRMDRAAWKIVEEINSPGVIWAAASLGEEMRFTVGEGTEDDRSVYRYSPRAGFEKLFACPEFTGSYLSFDGKHLYLSQWYKGQIHQVDDAGNILRTIDVGAEICGHTFVDGMLYVLRGQENKDAPNKSEEWRIARLDPREDTPVGQDLASVPFAARSLAFDGENFWSNHRAANETLAFALPH